MSDQQSPPEDPETAAGAEGGDDGLGVPAGARLCGNCRIFRPVIHERGTWQGECRAMLDRGLFPASAPVCGTFLPRNEPVPRAIGPSCSPAPRAERRPQSAPTIRTARSMAAPQELTAMTREELKSIIREALFETDAQLAPRWEGGSLLVRPGNPELQSKEIPVDALFHKVVMVRDRLRVLEQKINAHPKFTDTEKVEMQQYVTRCYGSLTTFNFLFADRDDQFAGDKGKGD